MEEDCCEDKAKGHYRQGEKHRPPSTNCIDDLSIGCQNAIASSRMKRRTRRATRVKAKLTVAMIMPTVVASLNPSAAKMEAE
jgi:hypothetical protein